MAHGGLERISFFVKNCTSIVCCVYNLKTHVTLFSVNCGVSFFIRGVCCLRLLSAYLQNNHLVKMLVILLLNHVYYTSHLDIVSYPLVALRGTIVTLLDSSVTFSSFC